MGEFGVRDLFGPRGRVCATEDAEVGLYFLVNTFGFSVGLWMVGSGKGEVVIENSSEFPSECRGELWATI